MDELEGAPTLEEVNQQIAKIVSQASAENKEEVLFVGHALTNDFLALQLGFPVRFIDTTNLRFLTEYLGQPKSLVSLLKSHLNISIRGLTGSAYNQEIKSAIHSSLEDAAGTMQLFHKFQNHPEGVVADSTAQTWNLRAAIEMREQKWADKLKKRQKKEMKEKAKAAREADSDVEMNDEQLQDQKVEANTEPVEASADLEMKESQDPQVEASQQKQIALPEDVLEPLKKKKRSCPNNVVRLFGMAIATEVFSQMSIQTGQHMQTQ